MNAYLELKNRHQEEINAFPLHFAFGEEQVQKKIKELNLDPDTYYREIVGIGFGGFILKKDLPAYREMSNRHKMEREEALASDLTGDGYIYEMFCYELRNHEYGYTLDVTDTLESLGLTMEQVEADPRLKHGLQEATRCIRNQEGMEW